MKVHSPSCPLCQHTDVRLYHQDRKRNYYQCGQCELVFVPPESFLSADQEHAEYLLHQKSCNSELFLYSTALVLVTNTETVQA